MFTVSNALLMFTVSNALLMFTVSNALLMSNATTCGWDVLVETCCDIVVDVM